MNRKEATILSVIILAAFVGTVFADPTTTSTTRTTLQTTSVDIGVFAGPFESASPALILASTTAHGNLTAAFSFSPSRGFVQVSTALLTLIYSGANAQSADQFSLQLNKGSPTLAPVSFTTGPLSIVVRLQGTDLRAGSNIIELGLLLAPGGVGSSVNVFELRLTVEYTFLG